jgi:two-component sensor histidine kinase
MKRMGLGRRLMGLMGLALLPLTVLASVQAMQSRELVQSRSEAAILGDTLRAATPMAETIARGQTALATLGAMVPSLEGSPEACSAALKRFVGNSTAYSFAGYTRVDGQMTCASSGAPADFSASTRFQGLIATPEPRLDVIHGAKYSATTILSLSAPVRDAKGVLTGIISLSIPQEVLRHKALPIGPGGEPLVLVVMDAAGKILTSSLPLEETPARLPKVEGEGGYIAQAADGSYAAFARVPLANGQIVLLGSWPVDRLEDEFWDEAASLLLPAAIFFASLIVIWLAAEMQVLRHIRRLRRAIVDFAEGDRKNPPPDFRRAAAEIADIGEAFGRMTQSVSKGEADLAQSLRQKSLLLREVHHRVKNNLQLIASILSMQSRGLADTEARNALLQVQDRVLALATIHRELYRMSDLQEVQMAELLPDLMRQHLKLSSPPGRRFALSFRIDDVSMNAETAVPLSLLLTEAMSGVFRHGQGEAGEAVPVAVELLRLPADMIELRLSARLAPAAVDRFGDQLVLAFADQIGGTVSFEPAPDWALVLRFPMPAPTVLPAE